MGNIHLIPTDKQSRLVIDTIENKLYYQPILHNTTVNVLTQHNYITNDNNDEKPKAEDWFFNPFTNEIQINCNPDGCKKIILTTDQELIKDGVQAIPDEFLEWYVQNPSCEFADVNDWMDTNGTIAFGLDTRYQLCNHLYK